jgi:hypothetical protein
VCEENAVGMGCVNKKYLDKGKPVPAPRIMSPDDLIVELGKTHAPEGFSTITKSWRQRRKHAGTYDEQWLQERHPYLPADFDYAFYNCAHPDLICDGYLKGNETIVLKHLHPQHETLRFSLPDYTVGLVLHYVNGARAACTMNLDTLHLDVPANRAYLVWRGQFQVGEPLQALEARHVTVN